LRVAFGLVLRKANMAFACFSFMVLAWGIVRSSNVKLFTNYKVKSFNLLFDRFLH
jgi:hypothetical protein